MSFNVLLSHDVDRVFKTYQYLTHDVRKLKLKRVFTQRKPYWMFEKIMKLEEKYNVRSTFFFLQESMPFKYWPPKNWVLSLGRYKFADVADVIKRLDNNGWEIGLHGSYYSYKDINLLINEKKELENVLGKQILGIRQHYLNLRIPDTWILQKKAGFFYDASYGKIGDIGFVDYRNNPFVDHDSEMFIIPLTFMEYYLFKKNNFDLKKIWLNVLEFINNAEKDNSTLSVLWHQRFFNEIDYPGYIEIYEKLINECKKRNATFLTHKEIYFNTTNNE